MKRYLVLLLAALFVTQGSAAEPTRSKKKCISPAKVSSYLKATAAPVRMRDAGQANVTIQNNILVLEADPDLLILSNRFDLAGKTVTFHPVTRGRYTNSLGVSPFDGAANQTIELRDDDSYELKFTHFAFPFGRQTYDRCYINSNGNITFQLPDFEPPTAETLQAAPRIAAFFTDLNPENQGGILIQQSREKVVVSWLKVPEFYQQNQFDYGQNTFQIVMYQDGRIQLVYSNEITATEGFVGIIPKTEGVPMRLVDFSSSKSRTYASLVENFHDYESVDIPLLMRSMYRNHPDDYDFVTLLSNFDLTPFPGAVAFAINVRNNIRGIGDPSDRGSAIFRDNSIFGSSGRLQNITFLGNLRQYPSDHSKKIADLNASLLEILAHEVGHRWLSYIKLPENGKNTHVLLGRDRSHWSFFFDTNGSYLEGNQINHLGSSNFSTGSPFQRYSDLDLYLMGLATAEEVADSFYVADPHRFSPDFPFSNESVPEANVRFQGSARSVRIEDVLAANGQRKPKADSSQKNFRHLFVLIVKTERPASSDDLNITDRLRTQWENFFTQITNGRGKMNTRIQ